MFCLTQGREHFSAEYYLKAELSKGSEKKIFMCEKNCYWKGHVCSAYYERAIKLNI